MPRYDRACACGWGEDNRMERWDDTHTCPVCQQATLRVWKQTPSVIPDDVPGGFVVENGFETPQRFYSKSAHREALAARGLVMRGSGEESTGLTALTAESLEKTAALLARVYGDKEILSARQVE